jgi:hypothetical protein
MTMSSGPSAGSRDDWPDWEGRRFHWWQRAEKAEHQKLMAHVAALRGRIKSLRAAASDTEGLTGRVTERVDEMLDDCTWLRGGERAHRYADSLEELIPLVAAESYLDNVLRSEKVLRSEQDRRDAAEGIPLKSSPDADLVRALGRPGSAEGCDDRQPVALRPRGAMAESLRSIGQARADQMRHDRLMSRMRRFYLPILAALTALLLGGVVAAVLGGWTAQDRDVGLALWAELSIAAGLGALGGLLSSALRLRDVAELNSFRGVVTFLIMQPLIGATFGLVSWLLLFSGMLTIASSDQGWAVSAVVAFAVGFSEPLFIGILGQAMGVSRGASPGGSSVPAVGPAPPSDESYTRPSAASESVPVPRSKSDETAKLGGDQNGGAR